MAPSTTSRTRSRPKTPSGSANSRRSTTTVSLAARRRAGMPSAKVLSDTGVEASDGKVGEQADDGVERRGHQDRAGDHRIVAPDDRVISELADARAGEDDFGEHRARQQAADADAEHGEGWQDGEPERVLVGDGSRRDAEGARHADVILAEHLQHRGPHHAREIADPAEADSERR